MIKGTVALPVWNSRLIAWLAMESLCRQEPPYEGWELVIFEELHEGQLGSGFFRSYRRRLKQCGCEDLKYLTDTIRWPLSKKWVQMAKVAATGSEYFCLCAADNYYSPLMLRDAEEWIRYSNWVLVVSGFFYDLRLDKVIRYEYPSRIGLQMAARTEKVRSFPMDEVNKGVDLWFSRHIGNDVNIVSNDHWKKILCTNGLNNISTKRTDYFRDPVPPFYNTDTTLEEIVPEDISIQLKKLSQWLRSQ